MILAAALLACAAPTASVRPPPAPSAPALPAPDSQGAQVAVRTCLTCHSSEMLLQQRLTDAQWGKVVAKMRGWGAGVTDSEVEPLVAWLGTSFGVEAGPFQPASIPAEEAGRALMPTADGPYGNGDREAGAEFFQRCLVCHGADARGGSLAPNLVDRPLLYRADDFAARVRTGATPVMPAFTATDADIANVLAWLRSLGA